MNQNELRPVVFYSVTPRQSSGQVSRIVTVTILGIRVNYDTIIVWIITRSIIETF